MYCVKYIEFTNCQYTSLIELFVLGGDQLMKRSLSFLMVIMLCTVLFVSCSKKPATQPQVGTEKADISDDKRGNTAQEPTVVNNNVEQTSEEDSKVADSLNTAEDNGDNSTASNEPATFPSEAQGDTSIAQSDTSEEDQSGWDTCVDCIVFPFQQDVEMSDLIAEVEIVELIKEVGDPELFCQSLFEAKIKKVYKAKDDFQANEIVLIQDGISKVPINGGRIFKKGDRAILIMMKASARENASSVIENTYWINSGEAGIYDIIECYGKKYAVKRMYADKNLKNIEVTSDVKNDIKNQLEARKNSNEKIKDIQPFLLESFEKKLIGTINNKSK